MSWAERFPDLLRFGNAPVPWNAQWTGESRYEVRVCRWAHGKLAAWQPHRPGDGRPLFAQPHAVRQRRSVAQFLCTVCGKGTWPGDRWWFGHGEFREGHFMTAEAPVHRVCAELALEHCPHLRAQNRGAELTPFPDGHGIAAALPGESANEVLHTPIRGRHVVGHLKFIWPESRVQVRRRETAA